jgi:hypothetical protein
MGAINGLETGSFSEGVKSSAPGISPHGFQGAPDPGARAQANFVTAWSIWTDYRFQGNFSGPISAYPPAVTGKIQLYQFGMAVYPVTGAELTTITSLLPTAPGTYNYLSGAGIGVAFDLVIFNLVSVATGKVYPLGNNTGGQFKSATIMAGDAGAKGEFYIQLAIGEFNPQPNILYAAAFTGALAPLAAPPAQLYPNYFIPGAYPGGNYYV